MPDDLNWKPRYDWRKGGFYHIWQLQRDGATAKVLRYKKVSAPGPEGAGYKDWVWRGDAAIWQTRQAAQAYAQRHLVDGYTIRKCWSSESAGAVCGVCYNQDIIQDEWEASQRKGKVMRNLFRAGATAAVFDFDSQEKEAMERERQRLVAAGRIAEGGRIEDTPAKFQWR